ncbi:MAG: M56 family metallopeptidase [Thermoanaerobaculia bacterium]
MSAVVYRVARWASEWVDPLVTHLWLSTLFLAFVLVIAVLLRRRLTASSRFAVVAIGVGKFAIPSAPFVALIERAGGGDEVAAAALPVRDALAVLGGAFRADLAPPAPSPWIGAVMGVWVGIAAVLLLRAMLVRSRLERLAMRSALPPSAREVAALERARRRIGVTRSVDLIRAAFAEAPAVVGILRPLVVLPHGGCPELSDEEIEAVLAHEVAHVRRHDNLVARLEFALCALFWFHPLLWIARRMSLLDRERACDEAVASLEEGSSIYLDALSKFCLATIAPRLPGVSCMATAKLKERMDYVMSYRTLRASSPTASRITLLGVLALVAFSFAGGIVAAPASGGAGDAFAVKVVATRSDGAITVETAVTDNRTQAVVAAPKITIDAGETGRATTSSRGVDIAVAIAPGTANHLVVDVSIFREGKLVQKSTLRVSPSDAPSSEAPEYTGQPMTLRLTDAHIRDVLATFATLTGLTIEVAPEVDRKVSVNWQNVPWDQALAELLEDNGLQYRLEGSTMFVSNK